ncbi:hypothetical protein TNCV_781801 [Trichonephila clavipes]|nr:hypothetical protein TNCV_781801 [Trichonephila clavipes]
MRSIPELKPPLHPTKKRASTASTRIGILYTRGRQTLSSLDIFEQQERKLLVQLINTTNERIVVSRIRGHETTPLRVKGGIEDVYSELDNDVERLNLLDETPKILLISGSEAPNNTSSRFMTTIKCVKRENNLKCPEIL